MSRLSGPGGIALLVALMVICLGPVAGLTVASAAESPLVLMYAFNAEGRALEDHMQIDSVVTRLGRRMAHGTLVNRPVILAESGVGMTNAALTAQFLIDHVAPEAILFSGIAGALDSSIQIGDIVVCSTWATHDYGYWGADGLKPQGIDIWVASEDSVLVMSALPVDSALYSAARRLPAASLAFDSVGERLPQIVVGAVGVSGNTFIDNRRKRDWLADRFAGDIVDMESAAVAQVCAVNGISFLAFRSASDLAGGSGSETAHKEISEFFRVAARNSSLVVLYFLKCL